MGILECELNSRVERIRNSTDKLKFIGHFDRTLEILHQIARDIFEHALAAVDPIRAVQRTVILRGPQLQVCETTFEIGTRPIYAIAIGKAASSMATGFNDVLGDRLTAGVLSGPPTDSLSNRWRIFSGGHPTPNEQSLAAAQGAFTLLDRANQEQAIVFALISGGGSAMMEWPADDDITLAELQRANQILVNCGASINEINVVRRAFSAVKGGGLARRAPHAKFITLIVSDTNKRDEASVASGPTLEAPASTRSAAEIVSNYQLRDKLPESVLKTIENSLSAPAIGQSESYVLLDNGIALEAAASRAQEHGFIPVIDLGICEQQIEVGSRLLVEQIKSHHGPACLISGGEFSCPVNGNGRGGRNLETALRCAQLMEETDCQAVVLSAGTDGVDGNSPAAGATADKKTIPRGRALGVSAEDYLKRSDSYGFFEKLNDAIVTGPTGTNVRDLRILLKN